ncbi:hypothetical protein [Streptomyces sp. NPDC050704]|uniref:hypothetical protein n=1 Tax=Streptomyces sp. NPDC050704 TaxID=3157219 RepID=UPI003441B85A
MGVLLRGALAVGLLAVLTAGIPWGLWRYVGWPLPDHVPTTEEISTVLTAPMSTSLLLNILACLLWMTWTIFVSDVLRTAIDAVQGVPWPVHRPTTAGPLHALAAALVSAVVLALLPSRDPQWSFAAQRHPEATAAAPLRTAVVDDRTTNAGEPPETGPTAVVRAPRDGIHDSLWRIAERRLGDGGRWPEIYTLNRGRPQADGLSLINPSLIQPGWVLHLPEAQPPPDDDHGSGDEPQPPNPPPPPGSSAEPPWSPSSGPSMESGSPTASPDIPQPTAPAHPSGPGDEPHGGGDRGPGPGIELPGGVFVGLGLAAATAAALLVVRRRRRIRYRPGSGERSDIHIAPVVRALRVAHDQSSVATAGDQAVPVQDPDTGSGAAGGQRARDHAHAPMTAGAPAERVIGVKEGRALARDLARSRGLGLLGPGVLDAVRALMVDLLSERHGAVRRSEVELLIPASDVRRLLGADDIDGEGLHGLRVTADLTQALQLMETELLTRTRSSEAGAGTDGEHGSEMVLIATPVPSEERRLQAILDNGSALGMAGILIGQWRPGGTLRVRQDGAVAATSPSHAAAFTGARLFTLPADDARALLDLLAEAAPSEHVPQAADPSDVERRSTVGPRPRLRRPLTPPSRREGPPSGQDLDDTARKDPTAVAPSVGDSATATSARRQEQRTHGIEQPTRPRRDEYREHAVRIAVLGRTRLTYYPADAPEPSEPTDLTDALTPRQREVLAYLALHRDGARREALTATIWPDASRERPYNSFHATLSQLRRTLRRATHDAISDITHHQDARYALDTRRVYVDLWGFREAVNAARAAAGDEDARQGALQRTVALYGGDFAHDVTAEWAEAPRETLRREYLDSLSALVRTLAATSPRQTLGLLERARELDRHNEAIYRDIARMQARLGQYDAVSRTLELLRQTLAELGASPSRRTVVLCAELQSGQGGADSDDRGPG